MYLKDLGDEFYLKGSTGVDIGMLIFFLIICYEIIIFANTAQELQTDLDISSEYITRYKV